MSGETIEGLYELVLSEVEPTVLVKVMEYTAHNQSKAAAILGLNRGTLRSKLKKYHLL
jgi:Fis family transcriptional regulator